VALVLDQATFGGGIKSTRLVPVPGDRGPSSFTLRVNKPA
jgi:hypothetical protein